MLPYSVSKNVPGFKVLVDRYIARTPLFQTADRTNSEITGQEGIRDPVEIVRLEKSVSVLSFRSAEGRVEILRPGKIGATDFVT